ncbi:TetR family transcriptional regulator C-terminal domain-containing protein [Streptomyces olivaceoviridis]
MAENTASDTERRGCLLAKGAAELAQRDPTVAGRSAETMTALLTLLRTEISAAQRHGDIDSAAEPERLAATWCHHGHMIRRTVPTSAVTGKVRRVGGWDGWMGGDVGSDRWRCGG